MKKLHFVRFLQNYTVIIKAILHCVKIKLLDFAKVLQNEEKRAAAENLQRLGGV